MSVFTRAIKPTAAPGRNCEIAIEAGTARLFNLIFIMQCRRRSMSLQIDNLENRTVRLLDFSLTNGISIFRKSIWNVSAPTLTESPLLHAEVSLQGGDECGYANLYFKGRGASGPGAGRGAGVDFE